MVEKRQCELEKLLRGKSFIIWSMRCVYRSYDIHALDIHMKWQFSNRRVKWFLPGLTKPVGRRTGYKVNQQNRSKGQLTIDNH